MTCGERARTPVRAYVGVGGNLGEPAQAIHWALAQLLHQPAILAARCSPLYRSAPVDAGGPDYINAVFEILTTFGSMDLLFVLQKIEQLAGRTRHYHHAPRTLDLDLLWFGEAHIQSARLNVPHPRMMQRAFVLQPLADLVPERVPKAALAGVSHQACERLTT